MSSLLSDRQICDLPEYRYLEKIRDFGDRNSQVREAVDNRQKWAVG
ncbi:hypothetical protein [Nostoc sp. CHAB 5715]|nr:hypothetical protein [Nostoc sp. CHAB 5715]MCC5624660.1 hypothetical protein [Nostoc sp. CHAB 5715]